MRILDCYCGAGGCGVGFARAGFDVVGVDHLSQPSYPFPFACQEVLYTLRRLLKGHKVTFGNARHGTDRSYGLEDFDAIHASPPCKAATILRHTSDRPHSDWIAQTRDLLIKTGKPYIIENVAGASLRDPIQLCGSSFGPLAVERHRLFEFAPDLPVLRPPPPCNHYAQQVKWPRGFPGARWQRSKPSRVVSVAGTGGGPEKDWDLWKWAMGIDWMMTKDELSQAVPPVYTQYIGRALLEALAAPLG